MISTHLNSHSTSFNLICVMRAQITHHDVYANFNINSNSYMRNMSIKLVKCVCSMPQRSWNELFYRTHTHTHTPVLLQHICMSKCEHHQRKFFSKICSAISSRHFLNGFGWIVLIMYVLVELCFHHIKSIYLKTWAHIFRCLHLLLYNHHIVCMWLRFHLKIDGRKLGKTF